MGKRATVAFFLSLLVILSYNYFLALKYPQSSQKADLQTKESPLPAQTTSAQPFRSRTRIPHEQIPTIDPWAGPAAAKAKEMIVETDLARIVITSSGARIKSYQLKRYSEENLSAKIVQKQISDIEQAQGNAASEARELLQHEKDKLAILLENLASKPKDAELVSLAATLNLDFSPQIEFIDQQDDYWQLNTALFKCANDGLTLNKETPKGTMELVYTDPQGRSVKKIFTFSNSNYSIGLDIMFSNVTLPGEGFLLSYGPDVGMPLAHRGKRTFGYQGPITCFQTGSQSWVQKEKYSRSEGNVLVRREHKGQGQVLWTGLENKYFLAALIPTQSTARSVIIERNRFGEHKVALNVPWNGPGPYSFQLFIGPKEEKSLKALDVSLEKSIDYGFFSPIARLIYQTLVLFSRWTRNFGWAIVFLCLVTKIIFYPLTRRSFVSMQKMQEQMKSIQPEMDALRERLKDSPQKLNKEVMELYRKKGVNPLASCQSGCLPMLLQMPVFFALYSVLYNTIDLRGAYFLGWIKDLSAKDPYYVLPVLMGISMFVQQKLTGMGTTGGAQQEQAKMMALLMPFFLTWIFASLPSGVVLYWFTFNVVTAGQQLLIRRHSVTHSSS